MVTWPRDGPPAVPATQVNDACQIAFFFMRQTDHKIELDGFPAGGKHFIHRDEQVCGGVALVDDLTIYPFPPRVPG